MIQKIQPFFRTVKTFRIKRNALLIVCQFPVKIIQKIINIRQLTGNHFQFFIISRSGRKAPVGSRYQLRSPAKIGTREIFRLRDPFHDLLAVHLTAVGPLQLFILPRFQGGFLDLSHLEGQKIHLFGSGRFGKIGLF